MHRLRAGHDAIAIGIETALTDDPLLTVRYADLPRTPPVRVVFDRQCRLPLDARLMKTVRDAPVVIVASTDDQERATRLAAAGAHVLAAATIGDALVQLRSKGVRSLLLEGGPRLAGASSPERRLIGSLSFRHRSFWARGPNRHLRLPRRRP